MGKKDKETKNEDKEVKKVKKATKDKDSTKVSKKDKKEKDSKSEKKHEDKEGGFLDTVKNIAEKALPIAIPIIEQVLPLVRKAVEKLFKKAPEKTTEISSEQEMITTIASSPDSIAAIIKLLQNVVPALVVAPAGAAEPTDASKAESIESKLPKILAGHDPKDLTNILSYLVNTLGKVVDKSPDTQATINTNTTVEIDKSGVKPMIKVTPNEQVAATEASREVNLTDTQGNTETELTGAVADLQVGDHA